MRDFNARDIGGNVIVNDNSTEYKLLIYCSNEELIQEENHRRKLLRNEQTRKNKIFFILLFVAALLCVAAYVWYQINGSYDMASIALSGAGVLLGFTAFQQSETQTEFEQRQITALNEIEMLLRERGER